MNLENFFDNYEPDEDIDSELQGFYDYIREMSQTPVYHIIKPERLREFEYSLREITKIAKESSPDVKIEYTLNKESNIGMGSITIETDEFVAKDIKKFTDSIQFASNIEFYPLTNGNIKIGIVFYGMTNPIQK